MARKIEVRSITVGDYSKSEFQGVVDDPKYGQLMCGFQIECTKDGKLSRSSNVYTTVYDAIKVADWWTESIDDMNELGMMASNCIENGWEPTGNLIFNGYFREYYDTQEREWLLEEIVVGQKRQRPQVMKYYRIHNGETDEEKFIATDKGILAVQAYAIAKLHWLYRLAIVEVDENKQTVSGGAFILNCVREYYEEVYNTTDFNTILEAEAENAIKRYKNEW